MSKTASNLSEAFLAVREYLWDGSLNTLKQTTAICICNAADIAKMRKMVTKEQAAFIKDTVTERIRAASNGRCVTVHSYMRVMLGKTWGLDTCKDIQSYRHGWLVKLSREFRDREFASEPSNP